MWDFIHWALFLFNFFNKMFLKENGVGGLSCVGVGKEQRKEIIRLFFFFLFFLWLALALISHTSPYIIPLVPNKMPVALA